MRPPSKVRVVGYEVVGPFREGAMELLLESAKRAGVVTEYDTGRGDVAWFNGVPGASLRDVRARAKILVEDFRRRQ
jgi:hypothetical protein